MIDDTALVKAARDISVELEGHGLDVPEFLGLLALYGYTLSSSLPCGHFAAGPAYILAERLQECSETELSRFVFGSGVVMHGE